MTAFLLKKYLWVLFLFLLRYSAVAQSYIFDHITTQQGLSSNRVHAVLQDSDGFYWIATADGLNRFDGTNFKTFRNEKDNPHSLSHNTCSGLVEDNEGNIWVSTYYGVSVFKKRKGYFENILLQHTGFKNDILNRIHNLVKDTDGNIWIASNGFWKYDMKAQKLVSYFNNPENIASISDDTRIVHLSIDNLNRGIWFSTEKEINFFEFASGQFFHSRNNPNGWEIFKLNYKGFVLSGPGKRIWMIQEKQLLYFDIDKNVIVKTPLKNLVDVRQVTMDNLNRIWISMTYKTSLIFDPVSEKTDSIFFKTSHSKSALAFSFNHMEIDRDNNYWISSHRGISIYNPLDQYYDLFELTDNFKTPISINSMIAGPGSTVWLGTSLGLFNYDLKTRQFHQVKEPSLKRTLHVYYLEGDSVLWIGFQNNIIRFNCKSSKILPPVLKFVNAPNFILPADLESFWIGDWNNGLYRVTRNGTLLNHYTQNTTPGSLPFNHLVKAKFINNELWIGMNEGFGFTRYDKKVDFFTHFNPRANDSSLAHFGTITDITSVGEDLFLIGTHGGGIYLWKSTADEYERFLQTDGLSGDFINSVLSDQNANSWISTSNGLSFFNVQAKKFLPIRIDFSFNTDAYTPNGIKRSDSSLLFFCKNKILEISPGKFNPVKGSPKILISGFKIFDKDYSTELLDNVVHLSHKQNFFSFEFSALKINPDITIQYAYMLEGFDKQWHHSSGLNFATYTNVPGGNYIFRVKATNDIGEWSVNETFIQIHITPPFWQTWWFIVICGVAFTAGLYFIYRYRMRQVKKVYALRSKISQDLHDEIGATLSSIHVYSSVASKAITKDPAKSLDALQHINENTRHVMENMSDIVWAINTDNFGETSLEGKLKNYGYELLTPLSIQCIYWVDKTIDKRLMNIEARKNILLISKEAMNNIAKYSDATQAMVKLEFAGKSLLLEIADNGKGISDVDQRTGNGLHNMKQRTESLGGQFRVNSSKNEGTIIRCSIPITNISD